ncbi:peroxin [Coemansia javaensis]|uniref:Peroxin n=1 Tax=Coemansia javaensis TaxID=2761396 RepID=A0A9W8HIG0_9FUNG|nr:peroxin [Coemansia javaensis]
MLDRVWGFARRHQRKLVIGAGVVGGLYYSARLLVQRLGEMQAAGAREQAAREGVRRRFDQNQRDCMFTIMSLLPELSEQVLREVDVERLIAELRAINKPAVEDGPDAEAEAEPPRRPKVEIWEDIKVQSFARTLIAVYAESLLAMLVHVQLNMVGRSTYLDSVVSKYTDAAASTAQDGRAVLEGRRLSRLTPSDEQNFLMLSWWFLNRGWRVLMELVMAATARRVGQLPLKERLSHRELGALFDGIHAQLRDDGLPQRLAAILLPLGDVCAGDYLAANGLDAAQVFTPAMVRLLDQVRDIIESPDFALVFGCCVDRLTAQLLEALRESFPDPVPPPAPRGPPLPTADATGTGGLDGPSLDAVVREFEEFSPPPESRVVVVQLLPRIAREGHQILNGVPNQYLENVGASRELQALSAAVYMAEDTTDDVA